MKKKKKHPPFSKMVSEALSDGENRELNAKMILDLIKEKYAVDNDRTNLDLICHELERGKETGEFLQTKGTTAHGFFKLNHNYVPPEECQTKDLPDYFEPPTPTSTCLPVQDTNWPNNKPKKRYFKKPLQRNHSSNEDKVESPKINTNIRNLDHSNPFVMGLLTMIKTGSPKSADIINKLFQDPVICSFMNDSSNSMDICDQLTEAQKRLEFIEANQEAVVNSFETDDGNNESETFFDCNSNYKDSNDQKTDSSKNAKKNVQQIENKQPAFKTTNKSKHTTNLSKFNSQDDETRPVRNRLKSARISQDENKNLDFSVDSTNLKSEESSKTTEKDSNQVEDMLHVSTDQTVDKQIDTVKEEKVLHPEVEKVLKRGIVQTYIVGLKHPKPQLRKNALMALCEIVHGSCYQREAILELNSILYIVESIAMDDYYCSNLALTMLLQFCEENLDTCNQMLQANVEKKLLCLTLDEKFFQSSETNNLESVQLSASRLLLRLSDFLSNEEINISDGQFTELFGVLLDFMELENYYVIMNLAQAFCQLSRHKHDQYSKLVIKKEKLGRLISCLSQKLLESSDSSESKQDMAQVFADVVKGVINDQELVKQIDKKAFEQFEMNMNEFGLIDDYWKGRFDSIKKVFV